LFFWFLLKSVLFVSLPFPSPWQLLTKWKIVWI
jgi:hypothetical protein